MRKYSEEYKRKLAEMIGEFPVRIVFNLYKDDENNLQISFRILENKKRLSNMKLTEVSILDENFNKLPVIEVKDFNNVDDLVNQIYTLSEYWLEEDN